MPERIKELHAARGKTTRWENHLDSFIKSVGPLTLKICGSLWAGGPPRSGMQTGLLRDLRRAFVVEEQDILSPGAERMGCSRANQENWDTRR